MVVAVMVVVMVVMVVVVVVVIGVVKWNVVNRVWRLGARPHHRSSNRSKAFGGGVELPCALDRSQAVAPAGDEVYTIAALRCPQLHKNPMVHSICMIVHICCCSRVHHETNWSLILLEVR
jgi:hypothetical protein